MQQGDVAQLAERVLSMHEVWGSIPHLSILLCERTTYILRKGSGCTIQRNFFGGQCFYSCLKIEELEVMIRILLTADHPRTSFSKASACVHKSARVYCKRYFAHSSNIMILLLPFFIGLILHSLFIKNILCIRHSQFRALIIDQPISLASS